MAVLSCSPERFLRWSPPLFTGSSQPYSDVDVASGHATLAEWPVCQRISGDKMLSDLLRSLRKYRQERCCVSPSHAYELEQQQPSFQKHIRAEFVEPVVNLFNRFRMNRSQPQLHLKVYDGKHIEPPVILAAHLIPDEEESKPVWPIWGDEDEGPVTMECLFIRPGHINIRDIGGAVCRTPGGDALLRYTEDEILRLLATSASSVLVSDTLNTVMIFKVMNRTSGAGSLPDPFELEIVDVVDHRGSGAIPLRLLLAAHLLRALGLHYFSFPYFNVRNLAQGARNDPSLPLPPDEEIIRTRKRISDFDLYSLQNDVDQAEQFFRWYSHKSDATAAFKVDDVIVAVSDTSYKQWLPSSSPPRYPLEPLPTSTLDYVASIRRTSSTSRLAILLRKSKSFTIQITRIIGVFSSRVVVGRLVSIDGDTPPATEGLPHLCIKLYDDRLSKEQLRRMPGNVGRSFTNFTPVEDDIAAEDAAYRRLEHVQGAVVPLYYGAYSFQSPAGDEVHGIMMEYIDAPNLDKIGLDCLPAAEQAQVIEGARNCVRVLQYAGVTQQDWHLSQILCYRTNSPAPDGSQNQQQLACILVDFAWLSMSTQYEIRMPKDDYGRVFETLTEVLGNERALLDKHYAPREAWDMYNRDVDPLTIPFHEIESD
ncbi:hypothetical protein FA95DRAFT_1606165 [Auriscalpium vulgare]|uniref:Uncharacterized protein n=1 Tax=Auriscalpium vulgare TaxID=40419 RepID=A0ACB8RU34_9AGAM|nr:hypothetical protein FA95DRAFT_1606165 [Auriscalpium vulgare]